MSDTVISVDNVSKSYLISHQISRRETTLRDSIRAGAQRVGRRAADVLRGRKITGRAEIEEFWALRGVSFEVKQGDILGVVGGNGAGKSTLLKILSRITEPSQGRIELRGRAACLLEVGTGFHGELTGRENIFLNGAILGMKKGEIRKKFDEIVAFAEVEKFLDTPVKRYSSGMYMRLAFSVAAHLEPEILIIDEVLAVGDAEFQKKCLGKIRSVSRHDGRTVIFVSHQMSAISQLCTSAIRLSGGMLVSSGCCADVIREHLGTAESAREIVFDRRADQPTITRIALDIESLVRGDVALEIDFESPYPLSPVPGIVISAADGTPVFGSNPRFHAEGYDLAPRTRGTLKVAALGLPLASGIYVLSAWLGDWHVNHDHRPDALQFEFNINNLHGAHRPSSSAIGYLDWPAKWSTDPSPNGA